MNNEIWFFLTGEGLCKRRINKASPFMKISGTSIMATGALDRGAWHPQGRIGGCKGLQEVWGSSAETCLLPSIHVGAPTRPHFSTSKRTLSDVNYLTYPMCKKPTRDASQKVSKRHNWRTFFWLVEKNIHFSYPKWGKVMAGSKIDKFEEKDEKRCVLGP